MSATGDLTWDERGLLPAVVQDATTGVVLMLAWINRESLDLTFSTGFAHFYSRSRQKLWKKGETSGNTLTIREVRVDCDTDAVVMIAEPAGPTCHTGKTSCFYRVGEAMTDDDGPQAAPVSVVAALESVITARKNTATSEKSYTKSLLDNGIAAIAAKIAEEQQELVDELPNGSDKAVIHETADLFFHMLVALGARGIAVDDVWQELARRFGVSGHVEKAAR